MISHKIYETSSLKKASKKCYSEVKNLKVEGATSFSIRDIDSNEVFQFKIHHPYVKQNATFVQSGTNGINPTIPHTLGRTGDLPEFANNHSYGNNDRNDIANLIHINSCSIPTMQHDMRRMQLGGKPDGDGQAEQVEQAGQEEGQQQQPVNIEAEVQALSYKVKAIEGKINEHDIKFERLVTLIPQPQKEDSCIIS